MFQSPETLRQALRRSGLWSDRHWELMARSTGLLAGLVVPDRQIPVVDKTRLGQRGGDGHMGQRAGWQVRLRLFAG